MNQDEANHRREMLLTEVENDINEYGAYRFNGKVIYTKDEWDDLKFDCNLGEDHGELFYDELFEVIDKEIKQILEWT